MLYVIDEYTRERLAIRVERKLRSGEVLDVPGGTVRPARTARTNPLGQWTGVYCHRPAGMARAVDHVVIKLGVTERRACRVIGQHRSTQRKSHIRRDDEDAVTSAITRLAERFGRYGYRRITALLRNDGWHVNEKRAYRIWRREGLKVPMKQPKRSRLWLNDGSCVRLRPAHKRPCLVI